MTIDRRTFTLAALSRRAERVCRPQESLYGANFVEGMPQGSYPYSRPSDCMSSTDEATHPRCNVEGCPDRPGRASYMEGEP